MSKIQLDPVTGAVLTIKLYKNVKNVPELRKRITTGEVKMCFVNPKLILEPFQLVIAANKALMSDNFTTKTVFTEILFNLSISKNITKSLQTFGISDDSKDILVLSVEKEDEDNGENNIEIDGEEVDLNILEEIRDLAAIVKEYKINEIEQKSTQLLDSIVSRIATKDFISY